MKDLFKIALVCFTVLCINYYLPTMWNNSLHELIYNLEGPLFLEYFLTYINVLGVVQYLFVVVIINGLLIKCRLKYNLSFRKVEIVILVISLVVAVATIGMMVDSGKALNEQIVGIVISEYIFVAFVEE